MGTRAAPVPVYTSSAQISGADKRTLTTTNPNSELSTTVRNSNVGGSQGYFRPYQTGPNSGTGSGAVLAAGNAVGFGWAMPISPILTPTSAEGVDFDAGTWTLPVHYSRPGGLATGDISVVFTVILFRASAGFSSYAEIGRVTMSSVTVTTTEASANASISGVAITFSPGDYLWLEVHGNQAGALLVDNVRLHTDSATALRFTAMPTYARLYAKALSDAADATDALARQSIYQRAMDDAAAAADAITRVVSMPRALADAAATIDALFRQSAYGRAMADGAAATDLLARQISVARAMADSAGASDALSRQAAYGRALQDNPAAADSLIRIVTANRALSDAAGVTEALARQAVYQRAMADAAATSDALGRVVIYRRGLAEALSAGGGTIIRKKRPTYIFE